MSEDEESKFSENLAMPGDRAKRVIQLIIDQKLELNNTLIGITQKTISQLKASKNSGDSGSLSENDESGKSR